MKKRFLFDGIMDRLHRDQRVIIITGPRQSGKTTLMKQVRDELKAAGNETFFYNLEDTDYLTPFDNSPKNLIRLLPSGREAYVFIDEIQYLKKPSNFLKYLYDEHREKVKLIVSGSSAFYIDEKFDDSLSGRKWLLTLYPMRFGEYLYFRDEEIYRNCVIGGADIFQPAVRREVEALFEDYVLYGGFPEVVTQRDNELRLEVLNDIIFSYLKKDVKDSGIKYEDRFYNLLRLLAFQVGNLVNKNELCKTIGISQTAVQRYLYVLKRTYQVCLISPFFTNTSKEIVRMPKVYFFDNGIRNMLLKNFTPLDLRQDKGGLLENVVFNDFAGKRDLQEIKFWRKKAGSEIDFVVDGSAYEVKYSARGVKNQQLQSFRASHPTVSLFVLFYKGEVVNNDYLYIPEFFINRHRATGEPAARGAASPPEALTGLLG